VSKHRTLPGRKSKPARHVRLYYWFMDTAAWKSLPPAAKVVYVGLVRHYNGSNNGKIGYSDRQAGGDAGVSHSTGWRMLRLLEDRGFIALTRRGAFSRKSRHASEWRLTEFACDVTGLIATKEFTRWSPLENLEHGFTHEPIRFHPRNRGGSEVAKLIDETLPTVSPVKLSAG
jgi:hypothetical protein